MESFSLIRADEIGAIHQVKPEVKKNTFLCVWIKISDPLLTIFWGSFLGWLTPRKLHQGQIPIQNNKETVSAEVQLTQLW